MNLTKIGLSMTSREIAEIILNLLGPDMNIVQKKLFANKQENTYEDIKHLLVLNKHIK